jgi:DNA topoisomerase-1
MEFKKEDFDPDFNWDPPCPTCTGKMIVRHGRFGPFLGCARYPECSGIINIPKKGEQTYDAAAMPNCPAIGCDGRIVARKSRWGKTFFSCSHYPDCDVIGNALQELPTKYLNYPKTAYVKKGRFKKREKASPKNRVLQKVKLSEELADLLGEKELSRPEVVKKIWEYIKKHQLQDPTNKRLIQPDAKLAKVFGFKESVDMMKLAGLLNRHLN